MNTATLEKVLAILRKEIKKWKVPVVGVIADEANDRPFETLISTVLSLRTKDKVTLEASLRLFDKAKTPADILKLKSEELEKLIYPVCFYRNKSVSILKTCQILVEKYGGKVPRDLDKLIELPGVGRKTANLVMTVGFDDYGICVDVHVHRISNRFGFIKTALPDESELVLRENLPKKHWKTYNDILVAFGQNLCVPVSPWCTRCPVEKYCEKQGVNKHR